MENSNQHDSSQMKKEASAFCLILLKNRQFMVKYLNLLASVVKGNSQRFDTAKINNFISEKRVNGLRKFNTTYKYVLQAQQSLPVYLLVYWSGVYKTTISPVDKPKETKDFKHLSIMASTDVETSYQVSLGRTLIIEPKFNTLRLTWKKIPGLQETSGELIFNLSPIVKSSPLKNFAGTYTDEKGSKHILTGLELTPGEISRLNKKHLPPEIESGWSIFGKVMAVVGAVSQALFMGYLVYEGRKKYLKYKAEQESGQRNGAGGPEAERQLNEIRHTGDDAARVTDRVTTELTSVPNNVMERVDQTLSDAARPLESNDQTFSLQDYRTVTKTVEENPDLQSAVEQRALEISKEYEPVSFRPANTEESEVTSSLLRPPEAE